VERPVQDWGVQVTAAQQGDLTAFTAVIRQFEDMAVGYAYALWSLAPRLQTAHHPDCWRGWAEEGRRELSVAKPSEACDMQPFE